MLNYNKMSEKKQCIHPSEYLKKQFLDPMNIDAKTLAVDFNYPAKSMQMILDGELPVNKVIARKLARRFDTDINLWLELQEDYDKENQIQKEISFNRKPINVLIEELRKEINEKEKELRSIIQFKYLENNNISKEITKRLRLLDERQELDNEYRINDIAVLKNIVSSQPKVWEYMLATFIGACIGTVLSSFIISLLIYLF